MQVSRIIRVAIRPFANKLIERKPKEILDALPKYYWVANIINATRARSQPKVGKKTWVGHA